MPQGSILSPTLFKVAMAKLPFLLDQIPTIRHALYADDITIWATQGSNEAIQDAFHEAVRDVQNYAAGSGLACAAKNSELLLVHR